MDNQMLEEVKTLAAEYGITVSDARHFQLDMLEQYPGIVPFPLGVAEPNNAAKQPDTASIGLDPELVAAIMRDLEHAQQQAPPDDPLERLAEQLEASDLPPPTETEDASLWTAGEDGLATPHSQEDTDSIANEPDTANTRESQPIASGRRRLVFIGLALLIIAAGITGVLLFRPQSQIETSTETTSTPQTTDAKSFPSTKTTVDPVYVAQKVADTALPHSSPMPSSQP
ncbi:MAG: hypothetical protein N2663_07305, partial [Chlorobi bacterium]|nr:hypothetical protein [Chlorobiota bacterium]